MMYVLRKVHACVLSTSLLVLVGCQGNVANLPMASANAVEDTSGFDAVVEIITPGGSSLCSGTMVSSMAVLTAAHCAQLAGEYTVLTHFGTFTTQNVQTFSGQPLTDAVDDPNDVAMLWFDSPIADASQGQVYNIGSSVDVGETLTLVGYGCDNFDTHGGTGIERYGTNVVYSMDDYINFMTPVNSNVYGQDVAVRKNRGRRAKRLWVRMMWLVLAPEIQVARLFIKTTVAPFGWKRLRTLEVISIPI